MAVFQMGVFMDYIPTPKWLKDKKATVNIKNDDNNCFLYCVLAVAHHQKNNPDRVYQICTIFDMN